MPIDVTQHAQYGVKAAKYNADKSAAATEGNQAALSQAESEWALARAEMQMDLVNRQEQEVQRQLRMADIKAKNPLVPDKALEGITDLDQAERIAQSFQELAASRPQSSSGSWSPPSGAGGQSAPDPDYVDPNEVRDPDTGILPSIGKKMDAISTDVLKKGALAREQNEELQRLSLEPLTSRFQARNR
jgi:hypothetical protein